MFAKSFVFNLPQSLYLKPNLWTVLYTIRLKVQNPVEAWNLNLKTRSGATTNLYSELKSNSTEGLKSIDESEKKSNDNITVQGIVDALRLLTDM